jgi:hypothetical protein
MKKQHITLSRLLLLFIISLSMLSTACSEKKISVFEANKVRRITGETEQNQEYIKTLSKECESNNEEIRILLHEMKAIKNK